MRPSSTAGIATATGRAWEDWVDRLDAAGARELPHSGIARLTLEMMPDSVERPEWWAQAAAVAYGQHVGLRTPGQTWTGEFQLSASRTVTGDKDVALRAWVQLVGSRDEFGGVAVEAPGATSHTEKWRYWRAALADGTRLSVNISDKPGGKASVGLTHSKLDSAEAIEYWRPVWKGLLAQL